MEYVWLASTVVWVLSSIVMLVSLLLPERWFFKQEDKEASDLMLDLKDQAFENYDDLTDADDAALAFAGAYLEESSPLYKIQRWSLRISGGSMLLSAGTMFAIF